MPFDLTTDQLLMSAAFVAASALISTVMVGGFLVWIPADHFVANRRGISRRLASPLARIAFLVGKNLVGALLVVVGIILSLPGVPGQGLLTIFVGLLLLDIPRKRKLELRLVRRPALRRTINRLRERFGRPALILEPDPPGSLREMAYADGDVDPPDRDDVAEP